MEKIIICSIGEIITTLHQNRDFKSSAVKNESATISRKLIYKEREKIVTQVLSVSIEACSKDHGSDVEWYEINWSALGSVPSEFATAYSELLDQAVLVSQRLTNAYVKKI
jgi:hypothetical protein